MRMFRRASTVFSLITAAPALAQALPAPAADATPIDRLEPAFGAAEVSLPAPNGNAVIDRLNALEARVSALAAHSKDLEAQLELAQGRIAATEVRAAKGVQAGVSPLLADSNGNFSFKARGVVDADFVAFKGQRGGYAYNSGTGFRRARLGVEGTAFKDFNWRLEVDFAGNSVAIQDAYLQYNGFKPLTITLGQFKMPFGLESNNSDNYNSFLERGMFTNAIGAVGGERRLGAALALVRDTYTLTASVSGDNESVFRSAGATPISAQPESWGINARATWEPVSAPGRIVHLGASGFWRTTVKSGDTANAIRLTERPNVRVDGSNIIDTGVIPNVENLYYFGLEGAAVHGPFSLAAEYGKLRVDRSVGFTDPSFEGYYVYGSWFVTGESRSFQSGNFNRLRPLADFDSKGGSGAVELLLRYDDFRAGKTPVIARAGSYANSITGAVNWYLTPNFKLQLNYIAFKGVNTPLDPIGDRTTGSALATRLHIDW